MLKGVLNSLRKSARKITTAAERPMRSAVQGTLLGKTRNNFIREPEASLDDIKLHSVGELCLTCRKCDARLFKGERTAPGNTFSFCCAQGQVQIPRTPRPPWLLDDYLTEQTPAAKHFRGNTRQFNNALSMASTGAKVSDRIASGVQPFTVCGKVHHRMGPLLPEQGARPAFAQLYILDPNATPAQWFRVHFRTSSANVKPREQTGVKIGAKCRHDDRARFTTVVKTCCTCAENKNTRRTTGTRRDMHHGHEKGTYPRASQGRALRC